jgi:hypothetical protein
MENVLNCKLFSNNYTWKQSLNWLTGWLKLFKKKNHKDDSRDLGNFHWTNNIFPLITNTISCERTTSVFNSNQRFKKKRIESS